ncbi:hypothetical protein D3C85_1544170 [compost metagenome]
MEIKVTLSKQSIKELAKEVAVINSSGDTQKRQLLMPTSEELQYTVGEVAEMSKQSEGTITRHLRDGLLIGSKVGKSWKITQNNYLKYINNDNSNK